MAKPEWGTKHRCTSCGSKFYDFHKKTLICPKCDAEVQPEVLLRSRRTSVPDDKKVAAPKVVKEAVPEKEAETEAETETDDDDGDVLLDGDDDDNGDDAVVDEAVVDEKAKTADT